MPDYSIVSSYLQQLQNQAEFIQAVIEELLEAYQAQPVGNGYIDTILDKENSIHLINKLTKLPVAITRITWWCNCTPETKAKYDCPHGMGGPGKKFGEGWYSECVHYPDFLISEQPNPPDEFSMVPKVFAEECNRLTINYIKNVLPLESFYSPCLCPGLWLHVPDNWIRKNI